MSNRSMTLGACFYLKTYCTASGLLAKLSPTILAFNNHLQCDLAELSHRFSGTTTSYGVVRWKRIEETP